MNSLNIKKALSVLVIGVALAPAANALVESHGNRVSTIKYAELNLNSTQGIEVLYNRIKTAASNVCRADDLRVPGAARDSKQCRDKAVDDAVKQINHPELTALHNS